MAAGVALGALAAAPAEPDQPLYDSHEVDWISPFGSQNPEAPPETSQFAFLVGDFSCEEQRRDPSPNAPWRNYRSRWRARYALNGWAIQDEYFGPEETFLGIRYFDRAEGSWSITFYNAPGETAPARWTGRMEASGMIVRRPITLPDGTAAEVQLSFHDVSAEGFRWQNDTVLGEHSLTTWRLTCRRQAG